MSTPDPSRVTRIRDLPHGCESFSCLAHVPPDSVLAQQWPGKGEYAVYEHTAWAPRRHELRWGDGTGQKLVRDADIDSVMLITAFDEFALNVLYTHACMQNRDLRRMHIPRRRYGAPSRSGALRLATDDRLLLDAVVRGDMGGLEAVRLVCTDTGIGRYA